MKHENFALRRRLHIGLMLLALTLTPMALAKGLSSEDQMYFDVTTTTLVKTMMDSVEQQGAAKWDAQTLASFRQRRPAISTCMEEQIQKTTSDAQKKGIADIAKTNGESAKPFLQDLLSKTSQYCMSK
jgi:hypothetical protein